MFLLAGKLMSYFCSAMLHLYPHKSVESFHRWLRWDLLSICFAVWAPCSVFLEAGANDTWREHLAFGRKPMRKASFQGRWWLLQFCLACLVAASTHLLIDQQLVRVEEGDLNRLDRQGNLRKNARKLTKCPSSEPLRGLLEGLSVCRKRTLRTAINVFFFAWCLLLTGLGDRFGPLWTVGAVLYSLGLVIAPPFSRAADRPLCGCLKEKEVRRG